MAATLKKSYISLELYSISHENRTRLAWFNQIVYEFGLELAKV
jgi:hypothetical protein